MPAFGADQQRRHRASVSVRGGGSQIDGRGEDPQAVLGRLNDLERLHLPERLFLAGDRTLLQRRPRVSVVGARKASPVGLRRAGDLASELAAHQIIVVSGLAAGVDTAAHQATIAAGGRTIAVIGTPLNRYYPPENRELQERIAREHLVVSQYPVGHPTRKGNFPRRNRTMALIVDASVIVEAGETSGSLSQGWEALRLNRDLFILESIVKRPDLTWPRKMIDYGAQVLGKSSAKLLESLPLPETVSSSH